MFQTLIFSSWLVLIYSVGAEPQTEDVTVVVYEPDCLFSVLENGPNGRPVGSVLLHQVLYYKIMCLPKVGTPRGTYCLTVFNCSVDNGRGGEPLMIIDEHGCTLEPWIFEHVEYLDDLTAGIRNPYPIRFRGSSSAVRLKCVTRLHAKRGETCERDQLLLAGGGQQASIVTDSQEYNIRHTFVQKVTRAEETCEDGDPEHVEAEERVAQQPIVVFEPPAGQ